MVVAAVPAPKRLCWVQSWVCFFILFRVSGGPAIGGSTMEKLFVEPFGSYQVPSLQPSFSGGNAKGKRKMRPQKHVE